MVEGVTNGFSKRIELFGVGYRAMMKGTDIELAIGFSHPVLLKPLEGNTLSVEGQTIIVVSGPDKCKVGDQVASIIKIRDARKDPYKNKGIRLEGARLRKKSGKKVDSNMKPVRRKNQILNLPMIDYGYLFFVVIQQLMRKLLTMFQVKH